MDQPRIDIWQFQVQLSQRLLRWSGFSSGGGVAMVLIGKPFWRGAGSQFAVWGLVDAAIGLLGMRAARAKASDPAAHEPDEQRNARRNLRRVLWINTALDVGYVTGGATLVYTKGRKNLFWRGSGWGIVIQGGFLLLFDLLHALRLR